MKDVFEELEAEVTQYVIDRKRDAIELKNLLIANDNLIVECLSQEVFCVATNSELNVARFTEMYVANTTAEARYKDTPNFDSVFVIGKMQASLKGKDNVIRQLKKQLSQLQVTRSDTDRTLRVQTTDSQITKLTDHVTHLQAQNDLNNRDAHLDYLRHLKESVETIRDIIEEAKVVRPRDRKKQVTIAKPSDKSDSTTHRHVVVVKSQKTNVPVPPSTGVNSCPNASGSQPKSHVKSNRISPAKGVNKLPVEDQPRTNKSHLRTSNRVDSSSRLKRSAKTMDRSRGLTTLASFTMSRIVSTLSLRCLRLQPAFQFEESTSPKRRLFLTTEEKSSVPPHNFPSMILQKIIWNSHICYRVVVNQSDLVSHKFVTQSMTTTLSIENESLIEGESNFEIYDNKMANVNAPTGQTLQWHHLYVLMIKYCHTSGGCQLGKATAIWIWKNDKATL
nr:hypothetical protein [Tanacetum cinerariifolium]